MCTIDKHGLALIMTLTTYVVLTCTLAKPFLRKATQQGAEKQWQEQVNLPLAAVNVDVIADIVAVTLMLKDTDASTAIRQLRSR